MDFFDKEMSDSCHFVAEVIKTKQDLHFQALRLIHYVIYRVICEDKDLQTYEGSVMELADAFHIARSNIYRDIDSLSDQLHATGMILGHKDPRKSWRTVTWLSRSYYNGRGTVLIKLSYSMVAYVKGIRQMFSEDYHLAILRFNSAYAIRLFEILSADRYFQSDANPEYEITDLRYWLDCEKKYQKVNDFRRNVIDAAISEINCFSDLQISVIYLKKGRRIARVRFDIVANEK